MVLAVMELLLGLLLLHHLLVVTYGKVAKGVWLLLLAQAKSWGLGRGGIERLLRKAYSC